jgi:excisionase family DNA binding protein
MIITKQAPAFMTIADACRVIGISRSSFYRARDAGRIGTVRAEGRPYVTRSAVVEYLADRLEESEAGS